MSITSAAIALNDLADQVVAAADLDDLARGRVQFSLDYSDAEYAICDALLATRTPLPDGLLTQIRRGVQSGWYQGATRQRVLAAIDDQERQNADLGPYPM